MSGIDGNLEGEPLAKQAADTARFGGDVVHVIGLSNPRRNEGGRQIIAENVDFENRGTRKRTDDVKKARRETGPLWTGRFGGKAMVTDCCRRPA
jgi:hypothetical protein